MKKLELCVVVATLLVVPVLLSLSACSSPQANIAEVQKSIRATEADFAKAAGAKDLEKALSFYAEDAVLLAPNEPIAVGKAAIRASWSKMLAMPDFALTWDVTNVEVAKSGDLAFDYGSYKMSYAEPSGRKAEDRGKFATVWKKLADGSWKAALDMSNSDQAAAQPGPAQKGVTVVKKAPPKKKRR